MCYRIWLNSWLRESNLRLYKAAVASHEEAKNWIETTCQKSKKLMPEDFEIEEVKEAVDLREAYEDLLDSQYPPPDDDYDYWESGPPATWDDDPEPLPGPDEEKVSDYNTWGNW